MDEARGYKVLVTELVEGTKSTHADGQLLLRFQVSIIANVINHLRMTYLLATRSAICPGKYFHLIFYHVIPAVA